MNNISEINRLKFEEFLWIIFIGVAFLNIYGDKIEEQYIKTNQKQYKQKANRIFNITLIITFLIYIYFFTRNYNALKNSSSFEKNFYSIKLLGSSFLLAGIICLICFQNNQNSFVGSPAI